MEVQAESGKNKGADEKSVSRRKAGPAAAGKKIRLVVSEENCTPLAEFIQITKDRDIKDYDLNDIVAEALCTVSKDFWEEKLDELTPLEWRVQKALEDPNMRSKLNQLLAAQEEKVSDSEDAAH